MFSVPGLWQDVDAIIRGDEYANNSRLAEVGIRCRRCHAAYLAWLEEYQGYCVASSLRIPTGSEILLRRQTFSSVTECLIVIKRLLATINEHDRMKLETETQALALLLREIYVESCPRFSWLFENHEAGVAESIFATKALFEEDTMNNSPEEQLQKSRARYLHWNNLLRGSPIADEQPYKIDIDNHS
jgi:hypothetical protein